MSGMSLPTGSKASIVGRKLRALSTTTPPRSQTRIAENMDIKAVQHNLKDITALVTSQTKCFKILIEQHADFVVAAERLNCQ